MSQAVSRESLRDVSSRLYRAALQPEPLGDWARSVAQLLGADIAGFTVLSPSGVAVKTGGVGFDETSGRDYVERYQYINPLREFWQRATCGKVFRFDDLPVDQAFRSTEFYAHYGQFLDRRDSLYMTLGVRSAKVLLHVGGLAAKRDLDAELEMLSVLREDLALSFEIAGSFMDASNMVRGVIRSLDQKGIGIAILSEDGKVEEVNGSMDEMLHAGSVLRMEGGRLAPGASVRLPEFPGLVHRTSEGGTGGRLVYQDASGRQRGSVIACPAPAAFGWEGAKEGRVVLLVTDSARPKSMLADHLRRRYGLTHAETRVAGMLLDGKTARQISFELKVQANSVRAHLKAVYAKTGTHSQVELLNMLQSEREQAA